MRYGLVHNIDTYRLDQVITHELRTMVREARNAKGLRDRLGWILGPPEWSTDGPRAPPDRPHAKASSP